MSDRSLRATAAAMVRPGTGILAVDESVATCSSRLAAQGIEPTEQSRRAYREVLLCAPGLDRFVSGAILFDETIRQVSSAGTPFADVLTEAGILPGIKVDTGAKPMAGAPGETVTEGLDGLRDRIREYRGLGGRFAKWRAVLEIGPDRPSPACVEANAHALARYAALCQEGGLVPIVESEVLMKGDHDLSRCARVTGHVLDEVFRQLRLAGVDLPAIVLKPSMVLPGSDASLAGTAEVAAATVECLRSSVPACVGGVAFLSGGQSARTATDHLRAIAQLGPHPWPVTFSFGRAIQDDVLATWAGTHDTVAAREVLIERVRANGEASMAGAASA